MTWVGIARKSAKPLASTSTRSLGVIERTPGSCATAGSVGRIISVRAMADPPELTRLKTIGAA
jgi:hypothetical protein